MIPFPYNALDGKVMVRNGRIGCFPISENPGLMWVIGMNI